MTEPSATPPEAPKRVAIGQVSVPLPTSRKARIALGGALCVGGALGFLPILGFWMIPLGVLVLSVDLAPVRRFRRRFAVWWTRKRNGKKERTPVSGG